MTSILSRGSGGGRRGLRGRSPLHRWGGRWPPPLAPPRTHSDRHPAASSIRKGETETLLVRTGVRLHLLRIEVSPALPTPAEPSGPEAPSSPRRPHLPRTPLDQGSSAPARSVRGRRDPVGSGRRPPPLSLLTPPLGCGKVQSTMNINMNKK